MEILHGIGADELIHIFISNRPGDVKPGSAAKLCLDMLPKLPMMMVTRSLMVRLVIFM